MSGYEEHASTFDRAGFYLPFSDQKGFPEEESFLEMADRYDYIPFCTQFKMREYQSVENQNSVFLAMDNLYHFINPESPSCFLESLTGSDNGRYSIIAARSLASIMTSQADPQGINPLHQFLNSTKVPRLDYPFFSGGLIGFWSYEIGLKHKQLDARRGNFIEQAFFMPGEILVLDRQLQILTIVLWIEKTLVSSEEYQNCCNRVAQLLHMAMKCCQEEIQVSIPCYDSQLQNGFITNLEKNAYCQMVDTAKQHILQGDIFQVVLSRRWKRKSNASPWQVYRQLRTINPSPYMFYLALPEQILMGASPEMQIKVEKGLIKSRPIAGTRKIIGDQGEDEAACRELLQDEKERAEHLMLVDLSRNDIGSVSCSSTVKVREFMKLEAYSHVVHIVSTVEGELKPEIDALEAFAACFPAGTLSGAPKRKAMEIINNLEKDPRGPYGGSVAYIDFNGSLDSCITIRSILYKNGVYYLQSGAGIVADSIPEKEDEETYHKARVLMLAIKEAEKIDAADDR